MNRKSPALALLLVVSLFAPLAAFHPPVAQGQTRGSGVRRVVNKLTDDLRARAREAQPGSSERVRVILNLTDGAAKDQ